jgi:AcrR family transcriptional regulator
MAVHLSFKVNNSIYIKDPEGTEVGRQMVKHAIDMLYTLGFEAFTFKKLAQQINTTEATIYRYFENKHRLLLYIINWYWMYMELVVNIETQHINEPTKKLKKIIQLLTYDLPESLTELEYNKHYLSQIVINESSKVYLVKEVDTINKNEVFKPYKQLCKQIAQLIKQCSPRYKYPFSLSSTLIESTHDQQYFAKYLPSLTDTSEKDNKEFTVQFITDLTNRVLGLK